MLKTLQTLVIAALLALGFAPVAALAKEEPVATTTPDKPVLVGEDFAVVKKAAKTYAFNIDVLVLKKAYVAAIKKTPAVYTVSDDATSIPSTAYMQALDKAQTAYLKARARASTKKKMDEAEAAYTKAVEEATELYLIPVESES